MKYNGLNLPPFFGNEKVLKRGIAVLYLHYTFILLNASSLYWEALMSERTVKICSVATKNYLWKYQK